jgi:hypothetical protein
MLPLRSEQRGNGSEGLKKENPIHAALTQHSASQAASFETSSVARMLPTTSLDEKLRIEQLAGVAGEAEGDGVGDGAAMAEHEEAPEELVVFAGQGTQEADTMLSAKKPGAHS